MIPRARVVASPCSGVAMAPGIACACHDEWAYVRLKLEKAFKGATRVFHPEDVVNLEMVRGSADEARLFDSVLRIVRHGLRWDKEDGGLVHIVPEPGDALVHEVGIERSPPVARGLSSEIGKHGFTWPYDSLID